MEQVDDRPFEHAGRAYAEAKAFGVALGTKASEVREAIDLPGRIDRHPFAMMAAAVGVGYLIGGGLFSRTTGRLLKVGLRVALLPIVRNQLEKLAAAAAQPSSERPAAPPY